MKSWLLSAMACCLFVATHGQLYKDDEFEKMKGKLPWPVDNVKDFQKASDIKRSTALCEGSGSPLLTIRSEQAITVKACAAGVVSRVFDIDSSWSVLLKHGNYFSVYSNLSSAFVSKGDTVYMQQPLGRISVPNGNALYELELLFFEKNKTIDPYSWLVTPCPLLLTPITRL